MQARIFGNSQGPQISLAESRIVSGPLKSGSIIAERDNSATTKNDVLLAKRNTSVNQPDSGRPDLNSSRMTQARKINPESSDKAIFNNPMFSNDQSIVASARLRDTPLQANQQASNLQPKSALPITRKAGNGGTQTPINIEAQAVSAQLPRSTQKGKKNAPGVNAHALVGLENLLTPDDYIKPTTKKVPRFGLVDIDVDKFSNRPLEYYEGLERKAEYLIEEMEKQLSSLRQCDTITKDFRTETDQLKTRIRALIENIRENLGVTNPRDLKDKIFAQIDEVVKLSHLYKAKSEEAKNIFKMFRETFSYENRRHSLIQSVEARIAHLISIIGKDLDAMSRFVDHFKLQARNEPFAQKSRAAAQDLLQRMQKYEPNYTENQREIELIYNVQSDLYEQEVAAIEEEAIIYHTVVQKISDGKFQLVQAAALEDYLKTADMEIIYIMNQMKSLFDVRPHPRYPRCPLLVKKSGFEKVIASLLQRSDKEWVKIRKVKLEIRRLINPQDDRGLFFQKQKFKIRDSLDLKIRELEDQLDTLKNVTNMLSKIEAQQENLLSLYATSSKLNYETAYRAATELYNKYVNGAVTVLHADDQKKISRYGSELNILQAEFTRAKRSLEKVNLLQFQPVFGKVFPVFYKMIDLLLSSCAERVEQLLSLKIEDADVDAEIYNLDIEATLKNYYTFRKEINNTRVLEYSQHEEREKECTRYEIELWKKDSELKKALQRCRNMSLKDKHKKKGKALEDATMEIGHLKEIFESGQHITDVIKMSSTKDVYGSKALKQKINDKVIRLEQIIALVTKVNTSKEEDFKQFSAALKLILDFTSQQNKLFKVLFKMMVKHFIDDIPHQLKNSPQNVQKVHQDFLKSFQAELDKVDDVNSASKRSLSSLLDLWTQGLQEINKDSVLNDMEVLERLVSKYSKVMRGIFEGDTIYRIVDYPKLLGSMSELSAEVQKSDLEVNQKKQMQFETNFALTILSILNDQNFEHFPAAASPWEPRSSEISSALDDSIQKLTVHAEKALDTNDTMLASSEYATNMTKWQAAVVTLLKRVNELTSHISKIMIERDKIKESPKLNLNLLFEHLSQAAKQVLAELDSFKQDCKKYKLSQSWFTVDKDKIDFIMIASERFSQVRGLKEKLANMVGAVTQHNLTEVQKQSMISCAQQLLALIEQISKLQADETFAEVLNPVVVMNPQLLDDFNRNQSTWKQHSEELLEILEGNPQLVGFTQLSQISKQMSDSVVY